VAHGIRELGIDNLPILEINWEGSGGCWMCFIDLELSDISKVGEVRGLVLTPSPMIPMTTIVTKSSHVTLSHCPKDGLVAKFITSGRLVS
jgi:hypothetical protein